MKRWSKPKKQKTPPEQPLDSRYQQTNLIDYLDKVNEVMAETDPEVEAHKALFADLSAAIDCDGL